MIAPPKQAGVGLRAPHHSDWLERAPDVGWAEAHSENYFADGGPTIAALLRIRERYPVSLHGVGLSLGSADPLDREHVRRLVRLARRVEPWAISEHVSWGAIDGRHTNDLLPMPRTEESLRHLAARIGAVQDALGRPLLIENVSSYFEFGESELSESAYLAALAREAKCGILLDVNNVYVNAMNHGWNAADYFRDLERDTVQEMHLAGHSTIESGGRALLLDTHDSKVCDAVWALYGRALEFFPTAPALIEWDASLPSLDALALEAHAADRLVARSAHAVA